MNWNQHWTWLTCQALKKLNYFCDFCWPTFWEFSWHMVVSCPREVCLHVWVKAIRLSSSSCLEPVMGSKDLVRFLLRLIFLASFFFVLNDKGQCHKNKSLLFFKANSCKHRFYLFSAWCQNNSVRYCIHYRTSSCDGKQKPSPKEWRGGTNSKPNQTLTVNFKRELAEENNAFSFLFLSLALQIPWHRRGSRKTSPDRNVFSFSYREAFLPLKHHL